MAGDLSRSYHSKEEEVEAGSDLDRADRRDELSTRRDGGEGFGGLDAPREKICSRIIAAGTDAVTRGGGPGWWVGGDECQ